MVWRQPPNKAVNVAHGVEVVSDMGGIRTAWWCRTRNGSSTALWVGSSVGWGSVRHHATGCRPAIPHTWHLNTNNITTALLNHVRICDTCTQYKTVFLWYYKSTRSNMANLTTVSTRSTMSIDYCPMTHANWVIYYHFGQSLETGVSNRWKVGIRVNIRGCCDVVNQYQQHLTDAPSQGRPLLAWLTNTLVTGLQTAFGN